MIHLCDGHVVRDYDGLIRPLCFTHAVRRAMQEMVDRMTERAGQECWDCLRPLEEPKDLVRRVEVLESEVDGIDRKVRGWAD